MCDFVEGVGRVTAAGPNRQGGGVNHRVRHRRRGRRPPPPRRPQEQCLPDLAVARGRTLAVSLLLRLLRTR